MSLRAISLALGLSITTVSRALADYSDVARDTKERVRAEAERIGYQPNQFARRLQKGKSDGIAFVIPGGPTEFEDPAFTQVIAGIGARLAETNYDLIVLAAEPGEAEARVYQRLVDGRRCDGVVLARARKDDPRPKFLERRGLPAVWFGPPHEEGSHASVDIDQAATFGRATERLLRLGHRRIALIAPPEELSIQAPRVAGYEQAVRAAGLTPRTVHASMLTEPAGFDAASALLDGRDPPTAIICATDTVAVGAYRGARRRGLAIGSDISIIGFGDYPTAHGLEPALTTLRFPAREMVRRTVEILIEQIETGEASPVRELWKAELLVRASDGPPP
ncbi:MAG: LacI family DNA-binding transcriptional regulator [Hyphomicrobiaceae bacterium]|nr:LacI family DNA-binding transcriptional regulator [Hyphomicrobiaceae bacterium]